MKLQFSLLFKFPTVHCFLFFLPGSILLESKIQPDTAYQKQQVIFFFTLPYMIYGGQLSRVVKASALGAEGPRFEPWQQHLMQLSKPSER